MVAQRSWIQRRQPGGLSVFDVLAAIAIAFLIVYAARQLEERTAGSTAGVETDPDQAWYWTPEWQAKEREADAALEAGRSECYEDGQAFLQALAED